MLVQLSSYFSIKTSSTVKPGSTISLCKIHSLLYTQDCSTYIIHLLLMLYVFFFSLLLLLLLLLFLFLLSLSLHYTLVNADRWNISRLNYQGANHFNQALDVFHNELQWKSLKCQLALEGTGADGRAPFGLTQAAGLLKEQPGTCQQPGRLATAANSLSENNVRRATLQKWEKKREKNCERFFVEIKKTQ